MTSRRPGQAAPLLFAFLWPAIYLFPFLLPGGLQSRNDFFGLYFKYKVYLLDALAVAHRIPGWSPSEAGGYPFLANPFTAALYPLNLPLALFYRLAGGYSVFDHQVFTVLGLCIFSAGLYAWLRESGADARSALVAALVMGTSLKMTELQRFPNAMHAAAWFPWLLLGIACCRRPSTRARGMGTIAASTALIATAGYPYFLYYAQFLALPYAAAILWPRTRSVLVAEPDEPARPRDAAAAALAMAASFAAPIVLCWPYLSAMRRLLAATTDRAGPGLGTRRATRRAPSIRSDRSFSRRRQARRAGSTSASCRCFCSCSSSAARSTRGSGGRATDGSRSAWACSSSCGIGDVGRGLADVSPVVGDVAGLPPAARLAPPERHRGARPGAASCARVGILRESRRRAWRRRRRRTPAPLVDLRRGDPGAPVDSRGLPSQRIHTPLLAGLPRARGNRARLGVPAHGLHGLRGARERPAPRRAEVGEPARAAPQRHRRRLRPGRRLRHRRGRPLAVGGPPLALRSRARPRRRRRRADAQPRGAAHAHLRHDRARREVQRGRHRELVLPGLRRVPEEERGDRSGRKARARPRPVGAGHRGPARARRRAADLPRLRTSTSNRQRFSSRNRSTTSRRLPRASRSANTRGTRWSWT